MKKRLFVGTFIDQKFLEQHFNNLQQKFEPVCSGKWVEPENFHFTYKFLGDVEEGRIPQLRGTLHTVLTTYKSKLLMNGLGVFPHVNSPKVLSIKIFNPGNEVFEAQKLIEKRLERLGFAKERKKFLPHLTLLRVKQANEQFPAIVEEFKEVKFAVVPSFSIHLIESTLTSEKPIYKILK